MSVFIKQGDAALNIRQATKRGEHVMLRELSAAGARAGDREMFLASAPENLSARLIDVLANLPGSPSTYADYAASWETDNTINSANNLFNHQLAAYRKSQARLSQYRLADGRAEVMEEQETGEFDEIGDPVTTTVVVQTAIDALPATIDQAVIDEETGEQTGMETVPNPVIVQDDAERAIAQAVLDVIPQAVVDFQASLS